MARGNKLSWDNKNKAWRYHNDNSPYDDSKPCIRCGQMPTKDGHDACIANLPGVRNACCGHGVQQGYVQFENGKVIRGYFEKK
jgi:hypothetical protein